MASYELTTSESVLYQGNVRLEKSTASVELILTNLNLVAVITTKKLFAKGETEVKIFPVDEIKIYDNKPQIKQKDSSVEIFLSGGEMAVVFNSMFEARKFVTAALRLLTGKTTAERGASKVKGAVGLVDDTLGISTVGTVKNVLENGVAGVLLGGMGRKFVTQSKQKSIAREAVSLAKDVLENRGSSEEDSPKTPTPAAVCDEQVEMLKKLKELVDGGILTQEEFDAKKKQLLGL